MNTLLMRGDVLSSRIGMTILDKVVLSYMLQTNYATGGTIETSVETISNAIGMDCKDTNDSINHLYEGGVLNRVEYTGTNRKGEKTYRFHLFKGLNGLFEGCLDVPSRKYPEY